MSTTASAAAAEVLSSSVGIAMEETLTSDDLLDADELVSHWDFKRITKWLQDIALPDVVGVFHSHAIDGRMLLEIDEKFATEVLGITHGLRRRKLLMQIDLLKKRDANRVKVRLHLASFMLDCLLGCEK